MSHVLEFRMVRPLLLTGLALGLPLTARGDGYRNPPPGPAQGRAGNATAWGDGPTGLLYNPAHLTGQEADAAELSLSIARTRTDFRGPDGERARSKAPWQTLPTLTAVHPREDSPWAWGIGVGTPFGQSVEWERDSPFRYSTPYFAEIAMVNITPAAARQMTPDLAVGAGLDVYVSTIEFRQDVPWSAVLGAPGLPDGEIRATGDGAALGGRAGFTWDPREGHRLGFAYRSRFRVNYDGDFETRGAPPPLDLGRRDFSTRIRYPDILAMGYGVRITDAWRAEIQVERLLWSVNREQPVDVAPPYDALVPEPRIPQRWKDTWTVGVGTDWEFAPGWVARAGYVFLESPVPDETHSPLLSDADRHAVSVGLGHHRDAHALAVSYTYSVFRDRDTEAGRFEYDAHLVGVSYGYAF